MKIQENIKTQENINSKFDNSKVESNTKMNTVNRESEKIKQEYSEISKDGDTLELTTDAALKKYSKTKLKQLLMEKKITKQQYDRVISQ